MALLQLVAYIIPSTEARPNFRVQGRTIDAEFRKSDQEAPRFKFNHIIAFFFLPDNLLYTSDFCRLVVIKSAFYRPCSRKTVQRMATATSSDKHWPLLACYSTNSPIQRIHPVLSGSTSRSRPLFMQD
jgi:hypothetical protein